MGEDQRTKVRAEIIYRFATNLNRIREAAKMTPEELDKKCGFEPAYISVETEVVSVILGAIKRIADELGRAASELSQCSRN